MTKAKFNEVEKETNSLIAGSELMFRRLMAKKRGRQDFYDSASLEEVEKEYQAARTAAEHAESKFKEALSHFKRDSPREWLAERAKAFEMATT